MMVTMAFYLQNTNINSIPYDGYDDLSDFFNNKNLTRLQGPV